VSEIRRRKVNRRLIDPFLCPLENPHR